MLKRASFAAAAIAAVSIASGAQAATLDDVKERGILHCIVNTGLPGFSYTDASGRWSGFDADMCRSVAAAVLGDSEKVKYIPATGKTRFTLLNSKEGDVIFRNTTWTFVRDVDVKLTFIGTTYYDGQGFIIRKSKGVKSAKELDGATVCIQTGTTTELNLADYFRSNNMKYTPVPIEDSSEARKNYLADRCDVYTTDRSGLAATRATFDKPGDHTSSEADTDTGGGTGPTRRHEIRRGQLPVQPQGARDLSLRLHIRVLQHLAILQQGQDLVESAACHLLRFQACKAGATGLDQEFII
mgnify:CR=1 FL=1